MGQGLCLTRNYCTHVLTQDLAHGRVGCLCLEYIAQAETHNPHPQTIFAPSAGTCASPIEIYMDF